MNYLLLAKIFIVALFIPGEFQLNLGPIRLEIYRIILGIALVAAFYRLLTGAGKHLLSMDKALLGAAAVGAISLFINHGFVNGLEKAGIFLFEVMGAYFLARFAITNEKRFTEVFKVLAVMVTIFLVPTLIEMLSGYKVVHEFAEAVTGRVILDPGLFGEKYMRSGMTRSTSAFSHPILNGTICAVAIPIAFYLYLRYKALSGLVFLLAGVASVFSALSSAPLLVLAVQIGIIVYVKAKQKLKSRMRYVVMYLVAGAVLVQLLSNRGLVKIIIQTATFNPHTGTHRLLIFEHIQDDIMRNPIWGSGIGAYWSNIGWMGQSIDNFWLAISFTYGIPFAVLVAITALLCLFKIRCNPVPNRDDYLGYVAKSMILSMVILGITVHLFGKINPLFYFVMGSSVFLCMQPKRNTNQPPIKKHVGRTRWKTG